MPELAVTKSLVREAWLLNVSVRMLTIRYPHTPRADEVSTAARSNEWVVYFTCKPSPRVISN